MKVLVVSCLVAFALCTGLPTGINNTDVAPSPRIIDGTPVHKNLYYEVAIISDTEPVKLCSGAFISTKWILTSAFCAKRRPTLRVHFGSYYVFPDLYEDSQLVEKVHCYPSYNPLTLAHDIALLELAAPMTNSHVTRVELPSNVHYSYIGLTATVSGWGPSPGGSSADDMYNLESKDTVVIDNAFCTREGISMSIYKICTEDRAVCEGDQGAPLVINGRIVAIASAAQNANNCQGALVTPYTRVSYYLSWIQQVAGKFTCTTCKFV